MIFSRKDKTTKYPCSLKTKTFRVFRSCDTYLRVPTRNNFVLKRNRDKKVKMRKYIPLLLLVAAVDSVFGECGVCNASTNVQCTSLNTYRLCVPTNTPPGSPTGSTFTCGSGQVCQASLHGSPCYQLGSFPPTNLPDCCISSTYKYACTTLTTFRLCQGSSNTPVPDDIACPASTSNCVIGGTSGRCSANGLPTSFTCSAAGRFARPNTACKGYYLCSYFESNNTFVRSELTCPGTTMFSSTERLCVLPFTCTTP